jgi:hypothetical protein
VILAGVRLQLIGQCLQCIAQGVVIIGGDQLAGLGLGDGVDQGR